MKHKFGVIKWHEMPEKKDVWLLTQLLNFISLDFFYIKHECPFLGGGEWDWGLNWGFINVFFFLKTERYYVAQVGLGQSWNYRCAWQRLAQMPNPASTFFGAHLEEYPRVTCHVSGCISSVHYCSSIFRHPSLPPVTSLGNRVCH
jgi:hypothetical protein